MKFRWKMIMVLSALVLVGCGRLNQETQNRPVRVAVGGDQTEILALTEALKKAWNRPVEVSLAADEKLFDEILQGNYDAGIGSPEDKERVKIGIWSLAAGDASCAVVIGEQPYRYSKELVGKKIGYPADFPNSQLVTEEGIQLNSYQDLDSMAQDLETGMLDAIMLEGPAGEAFMKNHEGDGYLISQLKDQPVLSRYLYSSSMDLIRAAAGSKKGE